MRQSEYPEVTLLTRCVFGYSLHVEDHRCRSGELIPDVFAGHSGGKETNSLRSFSVRICPYLKLDITTLRCWVYER